MMRDIVSPTAGSMIDAIERRDIAALAIMSERHSIFNYAVLHSGSNNLFLWRPETVATMHLVRNLRDREGIPVFFSMNTGANVFIYCFSDADVPRVCENLIDIGMNYRTTGIAESIRIG